MSDEQQGSMEPDEIASSRHFTEDEPAEDTEGHAAKYNPAKDDDQHGGIEPDGTGRIRP